MLMAMNETIKIGVVLNEGAALADIKNTQKIFLPNQLICEVLHKPCCLQPVHGPLGNLTGTSGFYGALQQGNLTMTTHRFGVTLERHETFTLPTYHFIQELDGIFVTRRPSQRSYGLLSFLDPFPANIWILIVLFTAMISLTMELQNSNFQHCLKLSAILQRCLDLFVFLARKSPKIIANNFSAKLLLTIWGLVAVILIVSYSGSLLSALIRFDRKIPFSSLNTLTLCIEENRCSFIFSDEELFFYNLIQSQNSPDYKRFYQAVNREKLTSQTFKAAVDNILSQKEKFYVTGPVSVETLSALTNPNCDLLLIKTELTIPTTLMLKKGDKLVEQLNRVLLRLDELGLFEKYWTFYTVHQTCDWFNERPEAIKGLPLPTASLHGPLLLLLMGNVGGFLCLILEIFRNRNNRYRYRYRFFDLII